VVTAPDYRVEFHRWLCQMQLAVRTGEHWQSVTKKLSQAEFALVDSSGVQSSYNSPVRLAYVKSGETVVVGLTTVLGGNPPRVAASTSFASTRGC